MGVILTYFQAGMGSLAAYLAAHVLLCLLPAFFIAGALSALMPKSAIIKYLGKDTPKWISYPAAAFGGFVLAVCSCTIMPLFASIHKKGAGLGPAITFLFVGPAVNILAISLTGVQIGMDIAVARIILSIVFGILIGLLMSWIFRKDEVENDNGNGMVTGDDDNKPATWVMFGLLLAILLIGTLGMPALTNAFVNVTLPGIGYQQIQDWLDIQVPANPSMGIEGISFHGLTLIGLLLIIGVAAYKGFEHIDDGFTPWTFIALGLITFTLLVATLKIGVLADGLSIGLTLKTVIEILLMVVVWWLASRTEHFEDYEIQGWLWEVWRFVKQIIPLLLVGVFVAGMARAVIPATWIRTLAGRNTWWANLAGVLFGVFMYFPTLVEVPVAQTFLSLGMQRGPLLAYLLADPELSLQSILVTNKVIGRKKTAVYVTLVTVFSTLAGLIFGWFVN